MLSKRIFFGLLGLILFASLNMSFALDKPVHPQEKTAQVKPREEKVLNNTDRMEKVKAPTPLDTDDPCALKKARIDNKVNSLENSHRFHIEKYQRIHDRLANLITKLNSQNINTSKLSADLEILKTKLAYLNNRQQALVDKLNELSEAPCDATTPKNNSLSELQPILTEIRIAAQDVKNYIIQTIQPDLKELGQKIRVLRKDVKETTKSGI